MIPFIGISIFALLLLWTVQTNKRKFDDKQKFLPGPLNLPFIGGILQFLLLGDRTHNFEVFHKACQRYGSTLGFRVGVQEILVTEDKNAIKQILTSPDWSLRVPETSTYHVHTFKQNLGLLFGSGDSWRDTRRFAIRSLGDHGFGEMRAMETILTLELENFMIHLEKLRCANAKNKVRMNNVFAIPALNVTWATVGGDRFNYNDPKMHELLHAVDKATENEFGMHPIIGFPFLGWIPGMSPFDKFKAAYDVLYERLEVLIAARRQSGFIGQKQNSKTTLIDSFLAEIKENVSGVSTVFNEKQMLVTLADFLGAGIDTTSNSLAFAMLYMLKYPEVQKRIQVELDEILHESTPTVFDRQFLPYTYATVLEVLRMANIVPIIVRTAACDTTVQGYFVEKGTYGILNAYQTHMDPNIWEDPEIFRPERFIDKLTGKVFKENSLVPFGGGKRSCVGQTVAKLTMFTFFATILQKYDLDTQETISMKPLTGMTNSPRPFTAQLYPRHLRLLRSVHKSGNGSSLN